MSSILFDVKLHDDGFNNLYICNENRVAEPIQFSYSMTALLNQLQKQLGWTEFWSELRNPLDNQFRTLVHWTKGARGVWYSNIVRGTMPEPGEKLCMYVLDHQPNNLLDMLLPE